MKPVTVGDLKDQLNTPFPRPMLHCQRCGQESSANSGDYWNVPKNHIFTCCGEHMRLVVKRTVIESVKGSR